MAQNMGQVSATVTPRQYISEHLSPYLRKGMVQAYRAQPENVLRYMGEFLIAQSIRQNPSQNMEIANHFLYDHSEPQNAPTPLKQTPTQTSLPQREETTTSDVTAAQGPATNGDTGIKTETDGDVTMGGNEDQVMADANASTAASESIHPVPPTG